MFGVYLVFFVAPFFYQVFNGGRAAAILCNLSCMVTTILLFVYEFIQYIKKEGFSDYIEDVWNKADVANIFIYGFVYFWIRIARPEWTIFDFFDFEQKGHPPTAPDYYFEYLVKFSLIMANTCLLILIVYKILNYLRILSGFGLFILLISQCLVDIFIFFTFMLLWIIVFTVLLYILRTDIPNYVDYPHLPWYMQLTIQVWRNSLGDIQPPQYEFWIEQAERQE